MKAHSRDGLAFWVETEEEKGNTTAVFEITTMQSLFEAVVAIDALGAVEIHPPQIGPLEGVMALEADSGRLVDEARSVSIPLTHCVSH
jgi:hypothetical protein